MSLASSSISALRTLETGQFFSASLAKSANLVSSRLGTLARSVRAERLMRNPWPSGSRVTAASVLSLVGVKPAPCRPKASAMLKHPRVTPDASRVFHLHRLLQRAGVDREF